MSPKVSIIITTYNNGEVIYENVTSVLNQDYSNLEIIIVNDGSTDNTSNVLDRNFKSVDKVKIIFQENQGLGNARNTGVSYAEGEYILFMDGDDKYLKENAVSLLVEEAVVNRLDWLVFDFSYIYDDKNPVEHKAGLNKYDMYSAVWNKLYKKDLIINDHFPERVRFEDMAFSIKAYLGAKRKGILHEILYGYVQRSGSITKEVKNGSERLDALVVLQLALDGDHQSSSELRQYVNYHYIRHLILMISESKFMDEALVNSFMNFHEKNNLNMTFDNNNIKSLLLKIYFLLIKWRKKKLALFISWIINKIRGYWRNA